MLNLKLLTCKGDRPFARKLFDDYFPNLKIQFDLSSFQLKIRALQRYSTKHF